MKHALPTALVVVAIGAHLAMQSCAVEQPVTVANLTEPQRTRVVHYGMTAVEAAGMTGAHVVNFIANKAGAPVDKVRDKLKELRGRLNRDADSLRKERVGLIVANADAARVDAAFISGLCKPLADEGDAVALAACQSRQAGSFSHRLCRVSNGAFVAVGTRLSLTDWQSANIRAEIVALNPAPNIVVVRNDTQAKWDAALAGNVPPLRACNEGE
jgi:hypothetical protein